MITRRAAALAALLAAFCYPVTPAGAETVTLRAPDGAIELEGVLLGYDGDFYRIETAYGVLTVDGALVDCAGGSCPGSGPLVSRFVLAGDVTVTDTLLPALIAAFSEHAGYRFDTARSETGDRVFALTDMAGERPGAEITLRASNSTEALFDLLSDQADMALALREVTANESAIAVDAGLGDFRGPYQVRVIARDASVPGVHPANPVETVSIGALIGVFSGEIGNWDALGGPRAALARHLTDLQTGPGEAFARRLIDTADAALAPDIVIHPTTDHLADALRSDPQAIAMVPFTGAGHTRILPFLGQCGFGVAPDVATIRTGDYPLTLPVYLYLPERRLPPVARAFLSFLRTTEARDTVRRTGFVAQDLSETPLDRQGERLANAIRAAGPEVSLGDLQRMVPYLAGNRRLSFTFRFLDGSTTLDPVSQDNVILLAAELNSGRFDDRELFLAGFSDGTGPADSNLELSRRRAETVREAIRARLRSDRAPSVMIHADGFGEALPMACDDTAWGRQVNRRVEAWVGPVTSPGADPAKGSQ